MKTKTHGFTLVELMIAVAIIGILAAITYPSYTANIREAKRADAKGALVSLANAMEQWKMQNPDPTGGYIGATLGAGGIFAAQVPTSGGAANYHLNIDSTATTYTLTATPVLGDDSELTLNELGVKTCTSSASKDSWCVNDTWK